MYMLNRAPELFPGALCCVAHCNFKLRGSESDGDRDFVESWCAAHGTECFVREFDTAAYASEHGISIEMAARELRYGWFAELCKEQDCDAVAVAHNANDNAETLILNLLRGTGSRGIRGMSPSREIGGATVLRPMLGITRGQIRKWMEEKGAQWREDSSNSSSEYKRNLIRNKIFPLFNEINPSFLNTLGSDMRRFAQVDAIADDYFKAKSSDIVAEGKICIRKLLSQDHWEYLLFRMLEDSGINEEQFSSLVKSLKSGKAMGGKVFGPVSSSSSELFTYERSDAREPVIELLDASALTEFRQDPGTIIMDASAFRSTPLIRPWKEGDWMKPLGMKGRKKLSDLFVDLKWSPIDKRDALVVELEGSHVAALLCERIDGAVRVTDSSTKIYRITFR